MKVRPKQRPKVLPMSPIIDPAFDKDALNLIVAVLLGGAIGVERQWRQRLAGLRTNTLVSLGAAIFVVFEGQFTDNSPTRVAAQVVTGIGFLGAGVIWKEGVNVRGLSQTVPSFAFMRKAEPLPLPDKLIPLRPASFLAVGKVLWMACDAIGAALSAAPKRSSRSWWLQLSSAPRKQRVNPR